jgi:two-component system OmpR family sensor kinase
MWRRRRTVLNEAVHELRRPLQALALAGTSTASAGTERSLRMAATALDRLDREINGDAPRVSAEPLAVSTLLEDSVGRSRAVAASDRLLVVRVAPALAGAGDGAWVFGDRFALAQALDNLLANAFEHGGPRIVVAAAAVAGRVRITVTDCARPLAVPAPRRRRDSLLDRLRGRSRHGHGLRVVRRIAAAHGGSFGLRRSAGGAEAVLELPLVTEDRA